MCLAPSRAMKASRTRSVSSTSPRHHSFVLPVTPLVPINRRARASLARGLVLVGPSGPLNANASALIATDMSVLRPPIRLVRSGRAIAITWSRQPTRIPRTAGSTFEIGSGVPANTVKLTSATTPAIAALGPARPM